LLWSRYLAKLKGLIFFSSSIPDEAVMAAEFSNDAVKGVIENEHLEGDDIRRLIRKMGSGAFPNHFPVPARVEGASLQGSFRTLKTLTQVSHENLNQKSCRA
jgi:hypothetical protein